ncbi:MAG: exodeoxyribonuclease VII large subunit, partial [Fusobacterium sp.]|nr:exodeoxyribonuclease VII large subunit [Fusobacterium sp.]
FLNIFNDNREKIIEKEEKIKKVINNLVENKKINLESKIDKVLVLNPINTLKRGYTVSLIENKKIESIDSIELEDRMVTILNGGKIISIVKEKIYEKNSD